MKSRCFYRKHVSYSRYGGRGISVCERWLKFENFLADMGERPPGTSLDRIRSEGGYEPGNCKWSTRKEQQRNRSEEFQKMITHEGRTQCASAWAEEFGIERHVFNGRLRSGWPIDLALKSPVSKKHRRHRDGSFSSI